MVNVRTTTEIECADGEIWQLGVLTNYVTTPSPQLPLYVRTYVQACKSKEIGRALAHAASKAVLVVETMHTNTFPLPRLLSPQVSHHMQWYGFTTLYDIWPGGSWSVNI